VERDEHLAALWHDLAPCGLTAVAGRAYAGPEGVRRSYSEARTLLEYVDRPGLYRYEDLVLERVLAGDSEARQAFVALWLGPLEQARHGERLIETLLGWVRARFSVNAVAEQLAVHPNTVRYRLEQIGALLDRDLTDPETQFELQLLLRLLGPEARAGVAATTADGSGQPAGTARAQQCLPH